MQPTGNANLNSGAARRPADYTVMVNRFKLLNLVQQLAHQDVMEMIEAVGLDALCYKSTMDKVPAWMNGGQRRGRFSAFWDDDDDEHEEDEMGNSGGGKGGFGGTTGRRRSSGAAAGSSSAPTTAGPQWRLNSRRGGTEAPLQDGVRRGPKGTVFQTEAQRDEYFSRLANPRSRARVIDGHVPSSQARAGGRRVSGAPPNSNSHHHNNTNNVTASSATEPPSRGGIMHRRQISFEDERTGAAGGREQSYNGPHQSSSFVHESVGGAEGQRSVVLPGAASSILNPSGSVFQSRSGRGLAPKVKPQGAAVDETVPMNVILQAAHTVRSSGGGAGGPSSLDQAEGGAVGGDVNRPSGRGLSGGSAPGSVARRRRGGPDGGEIAEDVDNAVLRAGSAREGGSAGAGAAGDGNGGPPDGSDAHKVPQTADEMVALVESMLDAQERALHEVIGDIDLSGARQTNSARTSAAAGTGAAKGVHDSATNTAGSGGVPHSRWEMEYLEDALLKDSDDDGEELDDLLVLSRMERRLAAMEEELTKVDRSEQEADAVSAAARQPAPRRKPRGEMPEAMRKRLLTARKDAFDYIAYNERQWNTSQVSQFTFAQRLTNALAEDGFTEVLEEVLTIMDDYVEGLADHELQ